MTFEIPPTGPAHGTPWANRPTRALAATPISVSTGEPAVAVSVSTLPTAPPDEVWAAMDTASRGFDRLAAAGTRLQFAGDGRSVAVLDTRSGGRTAISFTDALALAGVR